VEHTFQLRTKAAGWVEVRLFLRDDFQEDNRAILELPELKFLNVAVYTSEPDLLRPALAAHPQVRATWHSPSEYKADNGAHVVVLDGFAPPVEPKSPAIWIEPPAIGSPFRTRTRVNQTRAVQWRSDHEVASGIRSKELRLDSAQVFAPGKDDAAVAEVSDGPVILTRKTPRAVALGFHPGRMEMRFDLTTPLLLANILRWLEPDVFRSAEIHGGSVGSVTTTVDSAMDPAQLAVLADGQELPFTIQNGQLRFFAGAPGIVRVKAGTREQVHSLSLPEVGETVWEPPADVRRGLPSFVERAMSRDLWQWLAIAGALVLLAEWLMYGSHSGRSTIPEATGSRPRWTRGWRKAS
jgi:hypothetical protein